MIAAITPPPIPGPIYAYVGRDSENINKNKIDLIIAGFFISQKVFGNLNIFFSIQDS